MSQVYDATKPVTGGSGTKISELYQIIRDHKSAIGSNFSGNSAPSSGNVTGRSWFDNINDILKFYDGSGFTDLSEWSAEEQNTKWYTIASASSISVKGVHRAYITGTTTITNLTDAYDGQEVILLAGNSFTVNHTVSQLELRGSSNLALAANDTLTLIYQSEGTYWQEIDRSDNT